MGIKQDLIIGGVIIGAIILFREQIAGGLSQVGQVFGKGIGGLGTSFFDALKGAIPQPTVTQTQAGTITSPAGLQVEQKVTPEGLQVTDIGDGAFIAVADGTLEQQAAFLDEQQEEQKSFLDQLTATLSGILGPITGIPLAFAEEEKLVTGPDLSGGQFQGPLIDPTTGFTTGLTEAQAFAISEGKATFESLGVKPPTIDPLPSGESFVGGGPSFIGGQVTSLKPLSDVIAQFEEQFGISLTASQAADIAAQLDPDPQFEGFDFGTNTGQALAILGSGASFGQDTGDFELQKAIEAAKAQASLGGFVGGGLFANPDFPITLGEAFLGKSGTIVSQSISNLTPSQLQEFLEKFGSA